MTKLEYYSLKLPNKPGTGADALNALKEAGVSFTALWGYPIGKGKSKIDMVAQDAALLKKAAKKLKLKLGRKQTAFHFSGEDRPGAVAEVEAKRRWTGKTRQRFRRRGFCQFCLPSAPCRSQKRRG